MSNAPLWIKIPTWGLAFLFALYCFASWYILNETITPRRMLCTITPDQLGFSTAEALSFKSLTDGTELKGWLIPSTGDRALVVIHGVHSQSRDGSLVELAHAYTDAGFHVLLFDLRGHGQSAGEHVGLGWLERGDVRAAVNELTERGFEAGKIGIHGLSYGAAVSLLAAPEIEEIGAVIADSAFADARDVITLEIQRETGLPLAIGELILPGVNVLARRLYALDIRKAAPERIIDRISPRPILLIHGTEDSIIPFEQARRLKAAGGSNVELWPLTGYKHTEGIRLEPGYPKVSPLRERYLQRVTEFFRQAL